MGHETRKRRLRSLRTENADDGFVRPPPGASCNGAPTPQAEASTLSNEVPASVNNRGLGCFGPDIGGMPTKGCPVEPT